MKRTITYSIPNSYFNRRIAEFLHDQGYSEQLLTSLRHSGDCIWLNDEPVFMNRAFSVNHFDGNQLKVTIPEIESVTSYAPLPISLSILYEDEDLYVIDKPAGLPVHPSKRHPDYSLANALVSHITDEQKPFVYRCMNRLDKNTSGLVIIAKNPLSASILAQMVKDRLIQRTYYAIVNDSNGSDFNHPLILPDSGTIDFPIGREESGNSLIETSFTSIKRMIDYENGQPAITHYKKISSIVDETDSNQSYLSLLELHLETGRTHQIRVHMNAIGHPLIGDSLYNPSDHHMSRQALHAGKLEFEHPITHEPLIFQAPLPDDMQSFFPNLILFQS